MIVDDIGRDEVGIGLRRAGDRRRIPGVHVVKYSRVAGHYTLGSVVSPVLYMTVDPRVDSRCNI